ncbi:MAG: trigger factor [Alphaproteobacteria bacterium]|nr:MAG: trigger factor [Alphaproteobacteria bacterium]
MQIVETTHEGLKRELKVTVPKSDLSARLSEKLDELKGRVRLNGFRPGKVPVAHLRKVYGRQAMAEIVNDLISKRTGEILVERGERAAQQPEISMTEDEKEAAAILNGDADFEFTIAYEVLPDFELPDIGKVKVERPVVEVTDQEVEEQAEAVAESARPYEEKKGKAADSDRVTIDYAGAIGGEPFEGGTDTGATLIIGSGRFIPGFEEQLVGAKAGDRKTVKVTFPEDYPAKHLAGKEAEFDVTVTKVEKPGKLELTDEVAKQIGIESAERLRAVVRTQLEGRYGSYTRARVKRQILDRLDELITMELPQKMVEQEFNNIWGQVTGELERSGKTFADEDTTEEKAREEYRALAERRVRLGLLLARIGEQAGIQVSDDELQRALYDQVRQFPGQEQQVYEYFRQHPDAVAGLRAPIFEDKVIDHILAQAEVTDKKVSREELTREDDEA